MKGKCGSLYEQNIISVVMTLEPVVVDPQSQLTGNHDSVNGFSRY